MRFCIVLLNRNLVKNQYRHWIHEKRWYLDKIRWYKDSAEDVETRFDTLNYQLDGLLLKRENKKAIGLLKVELGGKIMAIFIGLRAKACKYLMMMVTEIKKQKAQKCVKKEHLNLKIIKNCLEATQLENEIIHLGKNKTDLDSI